jgi:O-methyltransferase
MERSPDIVAEHTIDSDNGGAYLELLKRVLTRYELEEYTALDPVELAFSKPLPRQIIRVANKFLRPLGVGLGGLKKATPFLRQFGLDWPANAETMIGLERLNQLHKALDNIRSQKVPGALIETGVWRGGAVIFMAAYLKCHKLQRQVYVADSFQGLPRPQDRYQADRGDKHYTQTWLSVGLETVKGNFRKYGLLRDNVIFVPGFFEDTMPRLDLGQIALLRLDGDMYQSTLDVLENLYFKVSKGGFVIVDDYGLNGARNAVHDFLESNNLSPKIKRIDSTGVYWQIE